MVLPGPDPVLGLPSTLAEEGVCQKRGSLQRNSLASGVKCFRRCQDGASGFAPAAPEAGGAGAGQQRAMNQRLVGPLASEGRTAPTH